jgi:hypothetical protein
MDSPAKAVCRQQGPPVSLNRASYPPLPDVPALPPHPMHTCTHAPMLLRNSCPLALILPTCTDGRSSMHTAPPACLPACLPSPRRLARRAHTQPTLVFPTDIHAPARLRAHCCTHCTALTLVLVLSPPSPALSQQRRGDNDDATIVLSRSSRRHRDHSPASPRPSLARTPLAFVTATQ